MQPNNTKSAESDSNISVRAPLIMGIVGLLMTLLPFGISFFEISTVSAGEAPLAGLIGIVFGFFLLWPIGFGLAIAGFIIAIKRYVQLKALERKRP